MEHLPGLTVRGGRGVLPAIALSFLPRARGGDGGIQTVDGGGPLLDQTTKLMVQLSYLNALRRGPDDHRHVLWLNTEDQLLQSVPLLLAPYLLGHGDLVRKGDKD